MKVSVILAPSNEIGVVDFWPGKKISLSPAWWKRFIVSSFVAHTRKRHIVRDYRGYKDHTYACCYSPMVATAVAEVDEKTMVVQSVGWVDVVSFIWSGSSKKLELALVADLKQHFAHHEGLVWPWLGRQA